MTPKVAVGATVRLTSSDGEVAGEGETGDGGAWSITAPPGVYGFEVVPPEGLAIRTFGPRVLHVGRRRAGINIALRLPRPQCLDLGERVRIVAPSEGYKVALVAGMERVEDRPIDGQVIDITRSELEELGVTAVALSLDDASSGLAFVSPGSPDLTVG